LGAFHFKNDGAFRTALQNVAGKQDQNLIAPQNRSVLINDSQAIGISIKREADLRLFLTNGCDEVLEILRHSRIRMMIWKSAIRSAIKFGNFTSKRVKQLRRNERSGSVACIDYRLHRTRNLNSLPNEIDVLLDDVVDL